LIIYCSGTLLPDTYFGAGIEATGCVKKKRFTRGKILILEMANGYRCFL